MDNTLNSKEQLIYNFIKNYILHNNYPPSVRDILKGTNFNSTSTISSYLDRLEKKGYINKKNGKTRSIEISDKSFYRKDVNLVPILGNVSAGSPILAEENIEGVFPISSNIKYNDDIFVLKITGNSMIEKGIFHDDLVIVRKQKTCNNGDIIIALINDEATCKIFYKEPDHFRLQPANHLYEPIIVDSMEILGKVIGLYRNI